jgi:hypothetical protein
LHFGHKICNNYRMYCIWNDIFLYVGIIFYY